MERILVTILIFVIFIANTGLSLAADKNMAWMSLLLGNQEASCDISHLNLCTTESTCTSAGGYWYNAQCNSEPETNYGTVISAGQTWLDRNLGASRVATIMTDSAAYGDLYQWGRGTDGHEKRNNIGTTPVLSSFDTPGHEDFITVSISPYDWREGQNDNLWQGASGINNPCPAGFRLPTAPEWSDEINSWGSDTNSTGAYNSPLKLVPAGGRSHGSGSLHSVGSNGHYWSATVSGSGSRKLNVGSGFADVYSYHRADGNSVRCLED